MTCRRKTGSHCRNLWPQDDWPWREWRRLCGEFSLGSLPQTLPYKTSSMDSPLKCSPPENFCRVSTRKQIYTAKKNSHCNDIHDREKEHACCFARFLKVVELTLTLPQLKVCFEAVIYLAYVLSKNVIDVTYCKLLSASLNISPPAYFPHQNHHQCFPQKIYKYKFKH